MVNHDLSTHPYGLNINGRRLFVTLDFEYEFLTIRSIEEKVIRFLLDPLPCMKPFDQYLMHALVHNHKFWVDHNLHSNRDINELGSKIEVLMIGFDV